jgi:tetratricopeptide (TPR) repeat protein
MLTWLLFLILSAFGGVDQTPLSARAHLGNGQKLMQMERFKEAAEEFQHALAENSDLTEARQQLAICHFELRQYSEARHLFQELIQMNVNPMLANYYLGRLDLLEQDLDGAISHFRSLADPDPFRDALYYLGVAYFRQEKFSEALKALTRAVGDNPRDYRVHHYLARVYQKLGQTQKAEQAFAETQRLHDYYLQGSVAIAACRSLLSEGKPGEAWEACRPLLETDDVDKLVALGILFGKSGEYERALEIWKRAVILDPDSSEVHYNLGLTAYQLKNLRQARQSVATAVQLRPDFFEANMLYGTILYLTAQDEEAIRVLAHAHELRPDDEEARKLLAHQLMLSSEALIRKKDLRRAEDLLEQAAALTPDAKEILDRLEQVRLQLRQEPTSDHSRHKLM